MAAIICKIDNGYLRAPPEGKRGHQKRAMHIAQYQRTTYPCSLGLFFHHALSLCICDSLSIFLPLVALLLLSLLSFFVLRSMSFCQRAFLRTAPSFNTWNCTLARQDFTPAVTQNTFVNWLRVARSYASFFSLWSWNLIKEWYQNSWNLRVSFLFWHFYKRSRGRENSTAFDGFSD